MTREEAIEAIKEAYGNSEYTDEIIKALEQEPKTGHWIDNSYHSCGITFMDYECNCCHGHIDERYDYCPMCGAKMFESQESEDNNAEVN